MQPKSYFQDIEHNKRMNYWQNLIFIPMKLSTRKSYFYSSKHFWLNKNYWWNLIFIPVKICCAGFFREILVLPEAKTIFLSFLKGPHNEKMKILIKWRKKSNPKKSSLEQFFLWQFGFGCKNNVIVPRSPDTYILKAKKFAESAFQSQ